MNLDKSPYDLPRFADSPAPPPERGEEFCVDKKRCILNAYAPKEFSIRDRTF
jgi:hypothetical protein